VKQSPLEQAFPLLSLPALSLTGALSAANGAAAATLLAIRAGGNPKDTQAALAAAAPGIAVYAQVCSPPPPPRFPDPPSLPAVFPLSLANEGCLLHRRVYASLFVRLSLDHGMDPCSLPGLSTASRYWGAEGALCR